VGSIPTAVWIGKRFYNKDVRDFGSGNAGATNTFRVLGKKPGLIVLAIDLFKGWLVTSFVWFFADIPVAQDWVIQTKLLLGLCALIGHIFPIWAQFRGGKGIATLLGFMLGVEPLGATLAFVVFILVFGVSRIVSLSSILAAVAFPFFLLFIVKTSSSYLLITAGIISILVIITHRKNISRLIKGEETKISFKN